MKKITLLIILLCVVSCVAKRPITINQGTTIAVYSSFQEQTNNNVWNDETARRDQQKDIVVSVDWGIKDKIETSLSTALANKFGVKPVILETINTSLGPADPISFGFSSVLEQHVPVLTEIRDSQGIDVLFIAKPGWRYYHAETPLYNKEIGIQSFEDGLAGHVVVDIYAIDLEKMRIIFPAVQDGITMQPFTRNFDVADEYAIVDRTNQSVQINDSYKNLVFEQIDNIISWYVGEVPISVAR